MDLRDYGRVLARRWVSLLIVTLLGTAAGASLLLVQPVEYQATSKAFVSTVGADTNTDLNQGSTFSQQIVKSYVDVATAPIVLDAVINQLGLDTTAAALATHISASAPLDTVVLQIQVTSSSPSDAARVANAVTRKLAAVVPIVTPPSGSGSSVQITQIQPATPPATPISPRPLLNLLLGGMIGLLLGFALAIVRERLDTRIRGISDIRESVELPLLGSISFDSDAASQPLLVGERARGPQGEAFRTLRTNLQFLSINAASKAIVVTSSIPSEGKSTSAANLAIAISTAGQRVLLVEADLRRPRVADYMGVESTIGLTDVLIGSARLEDAVQPWGDEHLHLLMAGTLPPNPSELLQSSNMVDLIGILRKEYDVVLFDAPPLLPVADAAILARLTDGALLASAANRVHKGQLVAAVERLAQVNARVLGVFATMVPISRRGGYRDAYGYGYGYTHGPSNPSSA